jgi:hypothetical protein
MAIRNIHGAVCRVASFSSPMRKHGGDTHVRMDPGLRALDAIAHTKTTSGAPRALVLVRRNGAVVARKVV